MVATKSAVNDLSAYGVARSTIQGTPLDKEELRKTHAFWSACNYLALGMIYLQGNPLLREPLKADHIKNRLLGHWGASPGLSFIYTHCTPETPGSIHEGGELGYVLSHACGAAFDNPDLIVAAVVGDGEAETGPLATSWHVNKFLNPTRDGVVLPILHAHAFGIDRPDIRECDGRSNNV